MDEFRSEHKFICTQGQLEIIKARLSPMLRQDANQNGACYRIRSLYFDDADDTAFFGNDAGTDARRKFRLRVYENTRDGARLEIKHKLRGGTKKDSCFVSAALCESLLRGEAPAWREDLAQPLKELFQEMRLGGLTPKIIVEYERSAFVCAAGNVRVTLDRNIAYSCETTRFLEDSIPLVPVLPAGLNLLEVKYDAFIPDYILQLLETGDLTRTTFSKFYLAALAQRGEYLW